jgi:cell wall-associated NlpC family hydrolase
MTIAADVASMLFIIYKNISPVMNGYLNSLKCQLLFLIFILALIAGCSSKNVKIPEVYKQRSAEVAMKTAIQCYMGTPYSYGGSSLSGIDCSGLVREVYKQAGLNIPRTVQKQYEKGNEINIDELRFGDIVFFNHACQCQSSFFTGIFSKNFFRKKKHPIHSGIYISQGQFVHASSSSGVCISNLKDKTWHRSFIGARRYLYFDR